MCNCDNTYIPIPMKVEKIQIDNPDRSLRTYDLSFVNKEDRNKFTYMPGQFCEFSILDILKVFEQLSLLSIQYLKDQTDVDIEISDDGINKLLRDFVL